MADSVRVVNENWDGIKSQFSDKIDAIEETMTEFSGILKDLATDGVMESEAHDAIVTFQENLDSLKECLAGMKEKTVGTVQDFVQVVDENDHNRL